MVKKLNREKQAAVLRRTQEQRKQSKKEHVLQVIQELIAQSEPLTFPNIASKANCSVSYLYKWPEITAYIHDLQTQKTTSCQEIEPKEPRPNSLKTLHEVLKQRLGEIQAENLELKRQNDLLRGHVSEIFELRSECERLKKIIQELSEQGSSAKVVPLHSTLQSNDLVETINVMRIAIEQELSSLGITLNSTLSQTINAAEPETVLAAIEALKTQLSRTHIANPGGWLNKAIKNSWIKTENVPQQETNDETKTFNPLTQEDRELVTPEELANLSTIFKDKTNE